MTVKSKQSHTVPSPVSEQEPGEGLGQAQALAQVLEKQKAKDLSVCPILLRSQGQLLNTMRQQQALGVAPGCQTVGAGQDGIASVHRSSKA
jgi:hypothetical protein